MKASMDRELRRALFVSGYRTKVVACAHQLMTRVMLISSVFAATTVGAAVKQPTPFWAAEQSWATQRLAHSPRSHEWVSVQLGDRTLRAMVTHPAGAKRAPVVLVMHEVFGLTDTTLNTADELAALGYTTIAPDMLSGLAPNGGGTSDFGASQSASSVLTILPDAIVNAEFDAWANYAKGLRRSDGRLGIVGLSWGGGAAFRYAATAQHDPSLKIVAVFYDVGPPTVTQGPDRQSGNQPPISVDALNVPIYGFYGSTDTRVMNSLQATIDLMRVAGKPFHPVVYNGADHAFMRVGEDPANSNAANARAVTESIRQLNQILSAM
jgi:carboxymethylenebutenolidase